MSAAASTEVSPRRRIRWQLLIGAIVVGLSAFGLGIGFRGWWSPSTAKPKAAATDHHDEGPGHDHAGHKHHDDGHDHSNENDLTMIEISQQARGNIRLKVAEVAFSSFTRTIAVPASVVERPGRSRIDVTAPLTGVVTQIYVVPGQAIEPGQKLFEMRLTHEELVQAQSDFLRMLEELDVVNKEIKRLEGVSQDGTIAGKVVLERVYERQKLEATLRAQEQALLLHGMTTDQVAAIRTDRKLLNGLTVTAPAAPASEENAEPHILQVEKLNVEQGQNAMAGEPLCELADHSELYVEGKAFQQDADLVNQAAKSGASVCAILETSDSKPDEVCSLHILYLANKIDPESRLFAFYATLPNEVVRDDRTPDGRRFIGWRFRPGQRLQLKVPVETWKERIVLPVEAVVQEGPESYVFREDGDHFHRCPVQVEYRDQFSVVLAEGNEIWPGDKLAMNSAQQLQLALKNKSGGGIDPHAGHNH